MGDYSFVQGLLVGQLSVLLTLCAFLKFFIFADAKDLDEVQYQKGSMQLKRKKSTILRSASPLSATQILNKTYYNTASHRAESLDWFNVLVAQAFAQFREDARSKDAILISLDSIVNGPRKPDFLDQIKITEVNMGDEFPIFSNCRIGLTDDGEKRLHAQMDIDLSDTITLAAETKLLLNIPNPSFITLPVALGVTITRFSGTLSIAFIPPANATNSTTMTFSLAPSFTLELSIHSLIGSRSRLQDIPKIAQLVESRLRTWLCERCVEPKFQVIEIPSMFPSKARANDRGQSEHDKEEQVEGIAEEVLQNTAKMNASTARRRPTSIIT